MSPRIATQDGKRKCFNCQQWKPLDRDHFHRSTQDRLFGFARECIECSLVKHNEYRRSKGIPAKPRKPKIEGMKYCRKCDTYYPSTHEFFNKDKGQPDGLKGTCKKCANAQSSDWRKRNPDKQKQAQHTWYDNKGADYHRKYNDDNREQARHIVRKRRARRKQLPDTLTFEQWQASLDYFKGCCAICGRPQGLWHKIAADHWIPLSHPDCTGTVATNIIPLCHGNDGCNNSKNDNNALWWLHKTYGVKQGNILYKKVMDYFEWVKQNSLHGD